MKSRQQKNLRYVLIIPATLIVLVFTPRQSMAGLRTEVDSLFAAGDYERVELLVLRANEALDDLSIEDRANICLMAGFSMIMLERESDAREFFRRALDADPTLRLDPVRISPKFRVVFDDVKASYRAREPEASNSPTMTILSGPRVPSVLMSLAVPGSGQWREGKRWRGGLILGAQLAAAGAFIWRLDEFQRSRRAYLDEQDRSRVVAAYDRYYDNSRWAWATGIIAGVVYIAAQTDLALLRHRETIPQHPIGVIEVKPELGGGQVIFAVQW